VEELALSWNARRVDPLNGASIFVHCRHGNAVWPRRRPNVMMESVEIEYVAGDMFVVMRLPDGYGLLCSLFGRGGRIIGRLGCMWLRQGCCAAEFSSCFLHTVPTLPAALRMGPDTVHGSRYKRVKHLGSSALVARRWYFSHAKPSTYYYRTPRGACTQSNAQIRVHIFKIAKTATAR
jgi:hypothetical protein